MKKVTKEQMDEVIARFQGEGECTGYRPFGSGHINDTYLLDIRREDGTEKKLILQRINHEVFPNPEKLMANIVGVTSFLRGKILEKGGDPERETLNLVPSINGKSYYKDAEGNYWRVYQYIENTYCYNLVEKPEDFYESAVAYGRFQGMLADYPADTLYEPIRGFHDTRARYAAFEKAVEEDIMGRAASVQEEIRFVQQRKDVAELFGKMQDDGKLPLRVTHNDTKLNNVMIDAETGKGICVVDLDTVMPGLAMNDFGDSIRFGANTALEDEKDLSKVSCDLNLFEIYVKGFLEGCQGKLTDLEIQLLPMGAKVMTYECGMRFLTDYLQGDIYFHIAREEHNLDRCRTQFRLIEDMERKWAQMQQIVEKYRTAKGI